MSLRLAFRLLLIVACLRLGVRVRVPPHPAGPGALANASGSDSLSTHPLLGALRLEGSLRAAAAELQDAARVETHHRNCHCSLTRSATGTDRLGVRVRVRRRTSTSTCLSNLNHDTADSDCVHRDRTRRSSSLPVTVPREVELQVELEAWRFVTVPS